MHLGPECARKAGLTVGKIKTIVKLSKSNKFAKISINQLDLFNGEAENL